MFSRRSAHDPHPNALTLALNHARAAGRDVLDLTGSNPTGAGIPYASEAIVQAFANPRRSSTSPSRSVSARRAKPSRLTSGCTARGLDPDHVLTASTSEAYSFLFKLLADPGEAILVPQPSYPLFEHLATFEEVRAVPYPLAYDGEWHIDLPALRDAKTETCARLSSSARTIPRARISRRTSFARSRRRGSPS